MPSSHSTADDKPILASYSGKAGSLTIPQSVTDIHHQEHTETEPLEGCVDRKFNVSVFTFGPASQDGVRLVLKKAKWTLVTPFGRLKYPQEAFTTCVLTESQGNLVFTVRQLASTTSDENTAHNQSPTMPWYSSVKEQVDSARERSIAMKYIILHLDLENAVRTTETAAQAHVFAQILAQLSQASKVTNGEPITIDTSLYPRNLIEPVIDVIERTGLKVGKVPMVDSLEADDKLAFIVLYDLTNSDYLAELSQFNRDLIEGYSSLHSSELK